MNNKGYTTVFFTMMISVLLLFTFTALEVVRIHAGKVKIYSCVHSMRSSIMADYNRALFEKYHLLFMDLTYETGSEAVAEEKIEDYLDASLNREKGGGIYTFTVEELAITGEKNILWEDMRQVKEQIVEYEKAAGALEHIKKLTEKLKTAGTDVDQAVKETETNGVELEITGGDAGEAGANEQETTESQEESVTVEDPRETLGNALKFGTLSFVMPNNSVSGEERDFQDAPSAKYEKEKEAERDKGFQDISVFKNYLKESSEDNRTSKLVQQAAFVDYVINNFSRESETKPDSVMQCETEYILKGKPSDYDNLEAVVDELIWIRLPVNYAYLLSDSEKKSEALTVAAGICTAAGTPALIEVVKYLLLGCWAYGETLCEMRTLLSGGEIAYVKTKENWNTDLKNVAAAQGSKKVEQGISYKEYLMILLAEKSATAPDACYARMLDVMELNIKSESPDFQITNCVGAMTIQGKISENPMFIKDRSKEAYECYFEEELEY